MAPCFKYKLNELNRQDCEDGEQNGERTNQHEADADDENGRMRAKKEESQNCSKAEDEEKDHAITRRLATEFEEEFDAANRRIHELVENGQRFVKQLSGSVSVEQMRHIKMATEKIWQQLQMEDKELRLLEERKQLHQRPASLFLEEYEKREKDLDHKMSQKGGKKAKIKLEKLITSKEQMKLCRMRIANEKGKSVQLTLEHFKNTNVSEDEIKKECEDYMSKFNALMDKNQAAIKELEKDESLRHFCSSMLTSIHLNPETVSTDEEE